MIKYDYEYFHKVLLKYKSLNFERYQHITEKDLLIQALCAEEITDYSTINWRWLSEDLYGREYSDNGQTFSFEINGELEEFIRHIISREETVRILTYLRDHCKECLFNEFYDKDCVENFETECARLISANIEESKRDQYHGDFAVWPRPNLKEIATPVEKKPEYSLMETAILKAIPKPKNYNCIISDDILLQVAYEFIDYFRASVKAYNESGREAKLKPSMSQKQQGDVIYNIIIRRANRYLYWDRNPVYQVFFILGCLMGMPDHRRSWYEENFAKGIGDYLEMTNNFKGSKEKIQNVIRGIMNLSQYQLDFDTEDIDKAMDEQTEQLKVQAQQQERLPKPVQEVAPDFNAMEFYDDCAPDIQYHEMLVEDGVGIIAKPFMLQKKEVNAFVKLITNSDRGAVLTTLHQRIDGHKGKDIGVVLAAAAYKYHVLSRTPSEAEFREEFPNIEKCSWKSISVWLKRVDKPEQLRTDITEVKLEF